MASTPKRLGAQLTAALTATLSSAYARYARTSGTALNAMVLRSPARKNVARGRIVPMSPEECRAHADACERMAESLGADNAELRDTMRQVAEQ
jgi:hypothetical protein